MKLNNRGFAISTMLYGIMIMVVLILYLLLSIMRSEYNERMAIADDTIEYLNKCATAEQAMERCFRTYNTGNTILSCNDEYEIYTSCMEHETNIDFSTSSYKIRDVVMDYMDLYGNDGGYLKVDPQNPSIYRFVGASARNYIKVGNYTGRIISINTGGDAKVLMDLHSDKTKFDKGSNSGNTDEERWTSSLLYNTLNNYYNQIDYQSKTSERTFYIGGASFSGEVYANDLIKNQIRKKSVLSKFGTVSLDDYLGASLCMYSNTTCTFSNIPYLDLNGKGTQAKYNEVSKATSGNWMATYNNFWTTNYANNSHIQHFTVGKDGIKVGADEEKAAEARLVIYLDSSTTINSTGNGTQAHPFVVDIR